jgi:hypothetical protein
MGAKDKIITAPFKAVKSILNIGKKSDSFEEIDYAADLVQNPIKVENRGKKLDDSYQRTIWNDNVINQDQNMDPLNKVYKKAIEEGATKGFTSGKSVNEIMLQDYTGNPPTKPKSTETLK